MRAGDARERPSPDMPPRRATPDQTLHYLVDAVTDYAIYMLDADGRVVSWNTGAERLKGYSQAEIEGRHYSEFFTPEDRRAGVPASILAAAVAEGRVENEGWRVRKDGTRFWALGTVHAVRADDGHLIGFAKVTRDMTEKRRAELELQRARDRIAQAQKMEALGKLTGGVAHDFNNILMVVSGQAQLLRRRLAGDERGLGAVEAIEAAARRGADLTRHLLSFSRRQRLTPVPISLQDRAAALRDLLSTSLPSSVRLEVDLPDDLWPVVVDPGEFEIALINFAVNARDAMPSGGLLRLTARNAALDGRPGDPELIGEFVAVSVQDTGVGIPPDILLKVFDPFFTTKAVDKGTGLGLSQIYGFAEQSGGRVTVESTLGEGATFTLLLPRAGSAPVSAADEAGAAPAAMPAQVLLVEDNPEVADVAASMLEELGHRVRIAGSGAEALQMLREDQPVDLVFSDIVMAGEIDGLDLARRIRESAPQVPILLATGYSQAAERIGAEFPILRKPYRLPELSHAISVLLQSSRAVAPAPAPKRAPKRGRTEKRGRSALLGRRRGYAEL